MRKQWQIALPPRAHYAPVGLQKPATPEGFVGYAYTAKFTLELRTNRWARYRRPAQLWALSRIPRRGRRRSVPLMKPSDSGLVPPPSSIRCGLSFFTFPTDLVPFSRAQVVPSRR
jgi:hypothetical protein